MKTFPKTEEFNNNIDSNVNKCTSITYTRFGLFSGNQLDKGEQKPTIMAGKSNPLNYISPLAYIY